MIRQDDTPSGKRSTSLSCAACIIPVSASVARIFPRFGAFQKGISGRAELDREGRSSRGKINIRALLTHKKAGAVLNFATRLNLREVIAKIAFTGNAAEAVPTEGRWHLLCYPGTPS